MDQKCYKKLHLILTKTRYEGILWNSETKGGRRIPVLSFLSYPLLLLYSYSDCSPIIEYTSDRWIQFVLFNTVCYTCCLLLYLPSRLLQGSRRGESFVYTVCLLVRGWNRCEDGRPITGLTPQWYLSLTVPSGTSISP